MVGGRDFQESKFNRATQALRQVGSSFKPYIYTAIIDQGVKPDDTVFDAQSVSNCFRPLHAAQLRRQVRRHHHVSPRFGQSRNIPALKVAESVGIKTVIDYAHSFGMTSKLPPYLPVALGAERSRSWSRPPRSVCSPTMGFASFHAISAK